MRTHIKLGLAALIATVTLGTMVSTASAGRLSVSNQNIRVTWSSLEFEVGFGAPIRCSVTIEGTFHYRSIIKVERALIGHITRAIVRRPCEHGTAWAYNGTEVNEVLGGTFPNSLPWHITYEGFGGGLPAITSLRLLVSGARFRIREPVFGLLCDYTTGANGNATGTANRDTATAVINRLVASGRIRSETPGCPEGEFRSRPEDGLITVLGSTTTRISVTLI